MADLSIMNALAVPSTSPLTMSSREIADLVESRHDSVKRSIERLRDQGVVSFTPSVETSHEGAGARPVEVYLVGKRDSYVVVAQLSPQFTARLVDRWQELEQRASNPVATLTRLDLLKLAIDSEEKRLALESEVKVLAPKAAALDRIATASGSTCITNAAKDLQMAPRSLFAWLSAHRWIYRRAGGKGWIAYQDRIQSGHLEHKVALVDRADGSEKAVEQVLVTPKGLTLLGRSIKTA